MSWFTDFILGRETSAGRPGLVVPSPMSKAMGAESIKDFAEHFRARSIDTQDPRAGWDDGFANEHPGTSGLTLEQIRAISRLRPVSPFINLFATQIGRHGRRRQSRNDVGYEIGLRNPRKSMSRAAMKVADEISDALERGLPMHTKMHMVGRDSGALDQGCGEIALARGKNSRGGNKPYAWMPFDAVSARLAQPTNEQLATGRLPRQRPVIQYERGVPVNVFAPEEVLWIIRRPRTDIDVLGYGYPEIEEAAETMAEIVKANRFNSNFFENGTHAKYFLKFRMAMGEEMWPSFIRQFQEQLKGLDNAHKIGAMLLAPGMPGMSAAEDVEKVSLSESPKDMEFRWAYGFYYRELAAIMGVDLDEIGMGDPADTGKSTLQEGDAGQRILLARERRVDPAVKAFEDELNVKFVQAYDEDFCIRFLGMGALSPMEQANLDKVEMESSMTWNEVRARRDLPKSKSKWADECPLHPVAAQLYMAEQGAAQAEQDGGEGGPPGAAEGQDGGNPPEGPDAEGDDFGFGFGDEEAA